MGLIKEEVITQEQ